MHRGLITMRSTHGSDVRTVDEIADLHELAQGWRSDEDGYVWHLKRLRTLGRGSFGVASLVQPVTPLPGWFPQELCAGVSSATAPPSLSGSACVRGPAVDGDSIPGDGNTTDALAVQAPKVPLLVVKEINLACCRQVERDALFREIHILRAVRHPNVVRYIDSCLDAATNTMLILMEYCDGGDLSGLIDAANRRPTKGLTEAEIWALLIQLMMALRCLHLEHRIIHRDLKPQNVFLTSAGIVKVGDFGVSAVLSKSVNFAQTFCGTPNYLAPELCEELPYNGKADLWSLGCVLYELLSHGDRAFSARSLPVLLMDIVNVRYTPINDACTCLAKGEKTSPNAARAGYGVEIRRLVGLFLQKDPANRASLSRLLRLPSIIVRARLLLQPVLLQTPEYVEQFERSHALVALDADLGCTATWTRALMSTNASPTFSQGKRGDPPPAVSTMRPGGKIESAAASPPSAPSDRADSSPDRDRLRIKSSFTAIATGPVRPAPVSIAPLQPQQPHASPNRTSCVLATVGSAVTKHGTVRFPMDSPMIPTVASEHGSPSFSPEPPQLIPRGHPSPLPEPLPAPIMDDPPALTALVSMRVNRHIDPLDGVMDVAEKEALFAEFGEEVYADDFEDQATGDDDDEQFNEDRVYGNWRCQDAPRQDELQLTR